MNKLLSFASKTFWFTANMIFSLSIYAAIFLFLLIGLIEFLDFACYVLDAYRSGHV